ncbi:hypothetical protein V6N13_073278 [Hibiscus sabdariffa]|uniref:Uncharacterized protein n=1 Tax=Hibiscus sabdariffa TaxID=183260 RepID=A0ABR2EA78_9ROSI
MIPNAMKENERPKCGPTSLGDVVFGYGTQPELSGSVKAIEDCFGMGFKDHEWVDINTKHFEPSNSKKSEWEASVDKLNSLVAEHNEVEKN